MHRQTPLTAGFVGYTGGGARALVDTANDDTGMQEMKGSFMYGEARKRIESPQNYGFTSVVLPAKKNKDGQIEECAEAYISFMGGNRSFPVAAVMDDRRHRPWGLKAGENAQYDDIGQMTLMRRGGLFLLSLDSEEEQSSGGAAPGATAGTEKKMVERMVSLRHVEKKKQERPKKQQGDQQQGQSGATPGTLAEAGGGQSSGKDHKHEGETVNTEIRATKKDIQILDGDTVVARYTRSTGEWHFTSKKMKFEAENTFEIRCKEGPLDLWGKPINFNGGGPTTPPFTVPGA
jgi:phage gp45-like